MTDYISRADAIEAVCDLYRVASLFSGGSDRREEWYEKAEKLLSKCPSADAVQGEWVDVENEPYCECSVCGSYIDNLDDDYEFCPRCGARMKGGAE